MIFSLTIFHLSEDCTFSDEPLFSIFGHICGVIFSYLIYCLKSQEGGGSQDYNAESELCKEDDTPMRTYT